MNTKENKEILIELPKQNQKNKIQMSMLNFLKGFNTCGTTRYNHKYWHFATYRIDSYWLLFYEWRIHTKIHMYIIDCWWKDKNIVDAQQYKQMIISKHIVVYLITTESGRKKDHKYEERHEEKLNERS